MSTAFDMVCQFISKRMKDSVDVKKTLALIIVRLVDEGERDPERLAETAFREWTGADRSAIGDRWATEVTVRLVPSGVAAGPGCGSLRS
jgi:hypothetical protein